MKQPESDAKGSQSEVRLNATKKMQFDSGCNCANENSTPVIGKVHRLGIDFQNWRNDRSSPEKALARYKKPQPTIDKDFVSRVKGL